MTHMTNTTSYYHMLNTPIGSLTLACDDIGLTRVSFGILELRETMAKSRKEKHPLLEQTELQLLEYFDKKRTRFELPSI